MVQLKFAARPQFSASLCLDCHSLSLISFQPFLQVPKVCRLRSCNLKIDFLCLWNVFHAKSHMGNVSDCERDFYRCRGDKSLWKFLQHSIIISANLTESVWVSIKLGLNESCFNKRCCSRCRNKITNGLLWNSTLLGGIHQHGERRSSKKQFFFFYAWVDFIFVTKSTQTGN